MKGKKTKKNSDKDKKAYRGSIETEMLKASISTLTQH